MSSAKQAVALIPVVGQATTEAISVPSASGACKVGGRKSAESRFCAEATDNTGSNDPSNKNIPRTICFILPPQRLRTRVGGPWKPKSKAESGPLNFLGTKVPSLGGGSHRQSRPGIAQIAGTQLRTLF